MTETDLLGGVVEEDRVEFGALAGLGHHVFDGVAPAEVVGGFLVGGEVFHGFVGLVEEEAGGVFFGLADVEAEVVGFFAGVGSVVEGGGFEGFDLLGLDEDGDGDDVHFCSWKSAV